LEGTDEKVPPSDQHCGFGKIGFLKMTITGVAVSPDCCFLQSNRKWTRQALTRLLTGDPIKDAEVRYVQQKAFGLPGTAPVIGGGRHPIERDRDGNIIGNFVLFPDTTKQSTSVIFGEGTAGEDFKRFIRKS
jgi:hypothetical protein